MINPDCKEFYDIDGNISYRLFSRTITCSDDCHPYRKTEFGQLDCRSSGGWCKDCGDANGQNDECIYNAIPDQGIKCPAAASGCRAYTGNAGKNVMKVIFDTFEDGTNQGWQGGVNSNESVNVGGHSLGTSGTTFKDITNLIVGGNKAYLLEFWAKGVGQSRKLSVAMGNPDSPRYFYDKDDEPILTDQWQHYTLGPIFTDWPLTNTEYLAFSADYATTGYYLDNIILKEVTANVFVIRNSWTTPLSCDNEYFDPIGFSCGGTSASPKRCTGPETDPPTPPAMLGCEGYRDSQNQTLYLKSFDHLCREEAVGCE